MVRPHRGYGGLAAMLRRLAARITHALRPNASDGDVARELASHLALIEDDLVKRGMTKSAARREARRKLGGVEQIKELHRDARAIRWLGDARRDLVYAWRMLWRTPGFTIIAILSIAFGTGANVAMFSAADAMLLRPLPVTEPDTVVTVGARTTLGLSTRLLSSYPDYVDLRNRATSFDGLIAFESQTMAITVDPKAPPRVRAATMVSANFFSVLGVQPEMGRGFVPDEDLVSNRSAVTVLSDAMWKAEFGSDPHVVGRLIRIAGIPFTVVGVAPERFGGIEMRYIRDTLYVPLSMWPRIMNQPGVDPLERRDMRVLTIKGRLKTSATLGEARAEVAAIGADLAHAYPESNAGEIVTAETEMQTRFQQAPLDASLILMVTVLSVAVLCVACANVAGLLSSRAPVRMREIALRLAIGAARARVVRQLITESVLMAMAGAAGGLFVARIGIRMMGQIQYPTDVLAVPEMKLDERALVFSLALAVTSAILFGLWPAIQTTRVDLVGALKTAEPAHARRRRVNGRSILVATQVALSLVLVTISAFAVDVFSREMKEGVGFRVTGMAKLTIDMSQARLDASGKSQFVDEALAQVRRLPSVTSATAMSGTPLFAFSLRPFVPEGFQLPKGESALRTFTYDIDDHFFETMGIAMLAGRAFLPTDTATASPVVIVNDTLARHYWPGESAIGKRIHNGGAGGELAEVVGVAATHACGYFGEPPQDAIYYPFRQSPPERMTIAAATSGSSSSLLEPLRAAVSTLNPDVPVYDVQTIESFYDARVTRVADVVLSMVMGIAAMGVLLTVIGLYGLVSYSVNRRTREMGIRIAIGASYSRLLGMVLREGMVPAWFGVGFGIVLSVIAAKSLIVIVFPLKHGIDFRLMALAAPLLVAVALVASFFPARRAARVSPTEALRAE